MSDPNQTAAAPGATPAAPPAAGAAPAPAAPAAPADDQSILSGAKAPDTQTPAEGAKPPEAAKDGKAADPAKPEGDKPKDGKDAKSGPPEKYEDFKLPEGVEIDKEKHEGFKTLARDLGLTQEGAQKLVDQHTAALKDAVEAPQKRWAELQTEWQSQVKADAEIGGAQFAAMKASIARAMDKFGTPGLRDALNMTGAGNNPDIVKFIARLSKASAEGTPVVPGGAAKPPRSAAEVMYPNQGKSE